MTDLRGAIDAVQAEFAHALDHHRIDDLVGLFTPDAVYTAGGTRHVGGADIRRRFTSRTGERVSRHVYSGLRLTAVEETVVRTTSVWVCYAANGPVPPDGVPVYMVADFDDVFARADDGRWLIAERTITPVFRNAAAAPRA
jgi:ketosteroid isomerase-like protein